MLVTKARVRAGESLLIVGIGGGVATAALQIARMLGMTVFVTSGSAEKLARAKALGAEAGIDHAQADFSKEIRKLTGKRGVDVVLDSVGKATWRQSIASAARGGRLVTCGATTGPRPADRPCPHLLEPADRLRLHDGDPGGVRRDAPKRSRKGS